ncbi:hypothetical protein [Pseudomonas sp. UMAB-08]|uniref:hypothetical protein n=1 Tax=Pseudomonas sp. UMAB-08 TaxID=1365375 RepID=UPI001C598ECF|nr:hypothetical protein [Pseudomonas sp. UMAB-08]
MLAYAIKPLHRLTRSLQLTTEFRNQTLKLNQFLESPLKMLVAFACSFSVAGQTGVGIKLLYLRCVVAQFLRAFLGLAEVPQLFAQIV